MASFGSAPGWKEAERPMAARYRVTLAGRVQGVGMRYFVRYTAELHGVTGWVRNLDGGDVELEAEGRDNDVEAFLLAVERGNRFSMVERMERRRIPPEGGSGFYIAD